MLETCCVQGCKALSNDLFYFKFPTSVALKKKWLAVVNVAGKVTTNTTICSEHFLESDYENVRGKTRLKGRVVPSRACGKVEPCSGMPSEKSKPLSDESMDKHEDITSKEDGIIRRKSIDTDNDVDNRKNQSLVENDNGLESCSNISIGSNIDEQSKSEIVRSRDSSVNYVSHNCSVNVIQNVSEATKLNADNEKSTDRIVNVDSSESDNFDVVENESHDKQHEEKIMERDGDKTKDGIKQKCIVSLDCSSAEDNNQLNSVDNKKVADENDNKSKFTTSEDNDFVRNYNRSKKSSDQKSECNSIEKQDIEDIITNYHIIQKRQHYDDTDRQMSECDKENMEVELDPMDFLEMPSESSYIEVSTGKDASEQEKSDCVMLLENVQVEIDPAALLQHPPPEADSDVEEVPIKKEAISLLTSSDEDEVIIQEPVYDTVVLSDETDEEDVPLARLRPRPSIVEPPAKKKKKKKPKKNVEAWGLLKYCCPNCEFNSWSPKDYEKHIKTHESLYTCALCGFKSSSKHEWTKHRKKHSNEKKYNCPQCSYRAKHHMSLLYHMNTHGKESSPSKHYSVTQSINRFGSKAKLLRCMHCAYQTKRRSDMRRHCTKQHSIDDFDEEDANPPNDLPAILNCWE